MGELSRDRGRLVRKFLFNNLDIPLHGVLPPVLLGARRQIESNGEMVRVIGGIQRQNGIVVIQITFTYLQLLIYVMFMLIYHDVPTLLSLRGMVTNGLAIPIH